MAESLRSDIRTPISDEDLATLRHAREILQERIAMYEEGKAPVAVRTGENMLEIILRLPERA